MGLQYIIRVWFFRCMEGNLSNHRKCQSADSIFPLTSYRLAQPHSKQNENLKNDNSEDDTNNVGLQIRSELFDKTFTYILLQSWKLISNVQDLIAF